MYILCGYKIKTKRDDKNRLFFCLKFELFVDKYIGSRYTEGGETISVADILIFQKERKMGINQGALTEAVFYILLSLTQSRHGYGIMQNVQQLSNGRITLAAGTLYGAINTLLDKGWIAALPEIKDSRKKEYIITDKGLLVLKAEISRLEELLTNGKNILGE